MNKNDTMESFLIVTNPMKLKDPLYYYDRYKGIIIRKTDEINDLFDAIQSLDNYFKNNQIQVDAKYIPKIKSVMIPHRCYNQNCAVEHQDVDLIIEDEYEYIKLILPRDPLTYKITTKLYVNDKYIQLDSDNIFKYVNDKTTCIYTFQVSHLATFDSKINNIDDIKDNNYNNHKVSHLQFICLKIEVL